MALPDTGAVVSSGPCDESDDRPDPHAAASNSTATATAADLHNLLDITMGTPRFSGTSCGDGALH
jgi:hypothetical protein